MADNTSSPLPVVSLGTVEQLRCGRNVIRQEAEALLQLADSLDQSFCDAVNLIRRTTGCVIVTGVGKAGLIGQKIVATLASTGTRAWFLHPTEAVHGDLGCVDCRDVVLAISNSGRSEEVLRLLPALAQKGIPVIAVTRDVNGPLSQAATLTLSIGRHREAGELALAPTTSTTAMLAVGDALALTLSRNEGFTERDFARIHPAGSLGRQLQRTDEVMRTGSELRLSRDTQTIRSVLVEQRRPGRRTGAVLLTDSTGRLTGIFTDSDLVRLFEQRRDGQMDEPIAEVMTTNPSTIGQSALFSEAIQLISERKLSELPVIDDAQKPVGLIDITDVIDRPVNTWVSQPSPAQTLWSRSA